MATRTCLLLVVWGLTQAACAGFAGAERATPSAAVEVGTSATSSSGAVWLAADRPGLSAVGKDFLFIGPMTVNRNGALRQYLWLALGTTIDRRLSGAPPAELTAVVISADGTPMTFDLMPWPVTRDTAPYTLPIEHQRSFAARVTNSQLQVLARASELEAYVTDPRGRSPAYNLVHGDPAAWLTGGGSQRVAGSD